MSLTQPFIDGVAAFDATKENTIYVNVLGGDTVSAVIVRIYNASNVQVFYSRTEVLDAGGEGIRTFEVSVPAKTLTNNFSYKVKACTEKDLSTSVYSSAQLFQCYVAPTFSFTTGETTITAGYSVKAPNLDVLLSFNKGSELSPAVLNYVRLTLYGIKADGIKDNVFASDRLYVEPLKTTIKNFSPTTGGQYTSFSLVANGETVDGMQISSQVDGLLCEYSVSATSVLSARNDCKSGNVILTAHRDSTTAWSALYSSLSFQFKEDVSLDWIEFCKIIPTGSLNNSDIQFALPMLGNRRVYNFRLVAQGNSGNVETSETNILSSFVKNYICDINNIYDITPEFSLGSVNLVTQTASYAPYGAQFPIVTKNAKTKYRQGTTTAVLLVETSNSPQSAHLDRFAQNKLVEEFNDWLTNGRAKILKDSNGYLAIIFISDSISNEYYKELGNGLASTSFSWMEVGKFTQDDFDRLGFFNAIEPKFAENSYTPSGGIGEPIK